MIEEEVEAVAEVDLVVVTEEDEVADGVDSVVIEGDEEEDEVVVEEDSLTEEVVEVDHQEVAEEVDEEHPEVVEDEVESPDSVDEDLEPLPSNPTSTPVSTLPRARNTCLLPET